LPYYSYTAIKILRKRLYFKGEKNMAETATPNRSYTFEDVWAALMEQKERQKEDALRMKEEIQKDALRMQKMDRFMKRLGKQDGRPAQQIRKNSGTLGCPRHCQTV
jgi:hypothetical protein